ncbi:MAG: phenylalanine--tRNA ligase subunit alpha [Elusimicrobiota bacterium]
MLREAWEKEWFQLRDTAPHEVERARTPDELESLRGALLGRGGRLTLLLKSLKDLPLEDRRAFGPAANGLKESLELSVCARRASFAAKTLEEELSRTRVDLTLPGDAPDRGSLHPLTLVCSEIAAILSRLGFTWAEGPHVETERNNFESLNFPADHPAKDMHDTFYVRRPGPGLPLLLRTHTSPVQVRAMEAARPPAPLRIMAPGRVFRHENADASHSSVFHQIEGLCVDKGVSFADLKSTLRLFLEGLFGPGTRLRLRPSFFPFTEPSAQVDVSCILCSGKGCAVCKKLGWLEILGAGMVHPNVLRAAGYDPEAWSGYAWGLGVERIAMLKYRISDIRLFYQNDLRFLEQFK